MNDREWLVRHGRDSAPKKEHSTLLEALRYLAGVCDYAATIDGQGFNGADAQFGHQLAEQTYPLTLKQAAAARRMLKKYRGQLQRVGFDVDQVFAEEAPAPAPSPAVNNTGVGKPAPILPQLPEKRATLMGDVVRIDFPFDWDTVNMVKMIPGRRFHSDKKYWTCPVDANVVKTLRDNGFWIDPEIEAQTVSALPQEVDLSGFKLPPLKRELFPFQREGVAFIESRRGKALIGDEMGLGKTIQALAWLALHPEKRPVVIVVPAHLKINWRKEIQKTFVKSEQVQILSGTQTSSLQKSKARIFIVNYDILGNDYETAEDALTGKKIKTNKEIPFSGWVDYLKELNPQVLIFDEAHYIKSSSAIRTKAVKKLAKGIPHVIALTGTPIVNRPIEGFNIAQVVNKTAFPDFWAYTRRYCDAKHGRFGWDLSGASNTEELHQKLTESIMIRRKKADVLTELPPKQYTYIPIEMDNRKEYESAEIDFISWLGERKLAQGEDKEAVEESLAKASRAEHLVKIEGLKQLCVAGKMKQAMQWIEDFLSENGNKLVVFAVHKAAIDTLMKKFKDVAVKVDGSCSADQRDKAVTAFQNDPKVKLFVGNIRAAGTGLTLTAASNVAFLELPWTPGELVQAEDRCHRIGQKDSVNVYYLLANATIEEEIAELLDGKRGVLDAVLDGKQDTDAPLLTELMDVYRRRGQ